MAGAIPSTKHQKLNAEPIREDPSKFYYHFLYKAVIVAIFLVILPLFPSQAPEFINQSLLTRNWELLHHLFAGIAISYGLFSRRNDETEKENNTSRFDTAQSYLSRFFQVSSVFEDEAETPLSDESKIQTWSSYQYHRNEPVVVAPKHSNFSHQSATSSRISEKPLLWPVRSLKSRVSDTSSVQSVNESSASSVSLNGSSSKSDSRRFSRSEEMEDNVVLPSPIPWRSESSKLEPRSLLKSQSLRSSRSNSMASSPSLSSPKAKEQSFSPSESLAKNTEDVITKKGFHKSSPPPPPPPPPMLFKSISMKPRTSSFSQGASFDKEMKRSFTGERKRNSLEEPTRNTVASMGFDEDTETEDDDDDDDEDDDVVGESLIPNGESSRSDGIGGCSSVIGEEGPDVDKKADEFIAKFREQIRLQRIDSIKRSAVRITRNSSR